MKKSIKYQLLVLLFAVSVTAQSYRFEISDVSLSIKQSGKWSDFTPFKEAKIVATFNPNKNIIAVHSDIPQYFKIKKYYDKKTENGKDFEGFDCVDNNSDKCYIEIQSKQKANIHQLYIKYRDRILVYNMKFKK